MKTFRVFRHPTLGLQAVKVGFSWPGAIFLGLWLLAKKLWSYAFAVITLSIALEAFEVLSVLQSPGITLFVFLAQLGIGAYVGFQGNTLLMNDLQKRGFQLIATVQAETPAAARGKINNEQGAVE
jgi:hypothetical protein